MKKLMFWVILTALLLPVPNLARGGEDAELMFSWKRAAPHFVLAPLFAFVQLGIHEGSHGIMGKILGNDINNISLFPHQTRDGFVFGSVSFSKPFDSKSDKALTLIAPQITNLALIATTDRILSSKWVEPKSRLGQFLFVSGEVWPWIDFTFHAVLDPRDHGDISRFADSIGMKEWQIRAIGAGISALTAYFIWKTAKTVFWDETLQKPKIAIAPTKQGLGLVVGMKW